MCKQAPRGFRRSGMRASLQLTSTCIRTRRAAAFRCGSFSAQVQSSAIGQTTAMARHHRARLHASSWRWVHVHRHDIPPFSELFRCAACSTVWRKWLCAVLHKILTTLDYMTLPGCGQHGLMKRRLIMRLDLVIWIMQRIQQHLQAAF